MKVYTGENVRNVGLTGHGDTGKTSLVSAFLYTAGAVNRLGRVADGSSVTDYDEEEIARGVSIWTALAHAEWPSSAKAAEGKADGNVKINFVDTPGYNLFITDTKAALAAADSCLLLVDAVAGVEVVTEKVWDYAVEYGQPVVFVVNKMDRENASFARTLEALRERFGRGVVPVALPLGEAKDFQGVIDLLAMKAYRYEPDGSGKGKAEDIPGGEAEAAKKAHEALIEMIAEGDDKLMEAFFDKGTLEPAQLLTGLRAALRQRRLFPVFPACGLRNMGSDRLLDLVVDYLPALVERGAVSGNTQPDGKGEKISRKIDDAEPLSLFVFKTLADPFAGRISYFKVLSGVLKNDATITNFTRGSAERFQHISVAQGKTHTQVAELHAGDIGVVTKLKDKLTGDTLGEKSAPIFYPPVRLPEPLITFAVEPKTRADEEKMSAAMHKILEEDPSLRFSREQQTRELLLAGAGQQHIEVVVSKLKKRYGVDVQLKAPKVPYRETIRKKADAEGKYKKQTGGRGQFGICRIKMEPLPRGTGFEFVDDIFGGAIPKNYIPSVEKGIVEAAGKGYLAGYPVVDFRVILYDGQYHDVDSSDLAFKIAGSLAFKKCMEQGRASLLEPVMNVEVYVPQDSSGDLMGVISGRRGRIQGTETRGQFAVIKAQVPMGEMLDFATALTSLTQGRGSYHME
ncbi:MAG: elongation factor G, partial [Acidobacteria bacterium]|nr:elongation factor G [Acidobacteriota bacterium]